MPGGELPRRAGDLQRNRPYGDACALVQAVLTTPLPGFRIYLPAAKDNYIGKPPGELIRKYYENVPLRKPIDQINSFIDTTKIREETGWEPHDL